MCVESSKEVAMVFSVCRELKGDGNGCWVCWELTGCNYCMCVERTKEVAMVGTRMRLHRL